MDENTFSAGPDLINKASMVSLRRSLGDTSPEAVQEYKDYMQTLEPMQRAAMLYKYSIKPAMEGGEPAARADVYRRLAEIKGSMMRMAPDEETRKRGEMYDTTDYLREVLPAEHPMFQLQTLEEEIQSAQTAAQQYMEASGIAPDAVPSVLHPKTALDDAYRELSNEYSLRIGGGAAQTFKDLSVEALREKLDLVDQYRQSLTIAIGDRDAKLGANSGSPQSYGRYLVGKFWDKHKAAVTSVAEATASGGDVVQVEQKARLVAQLDEAKAEFQSAATPEARDKAGTRVSQLTSAVARLETAAVPGQAVFSGVARMMNAPLFAAGAVVQARKALAPHDPIGNMKVSSGGVDYVNTFGHLAVYGPEAVKDTVIKQALLSVGYTAGADYNDKVAMKDRKLKEAEVARQKLAALLTSPGTGEAMSAMLSGSTVADVVEWQNKQKAAAVLGPLAGTAGLLSGRATPEKNRMWSAYLKLAGLQQDAQQFAETMAYKRENQGRVDQRQEKKLANDAGKLTAAQQAKKEELDFKRKKEEFNQKEKAAKLVALGVVPPAPTISSPTK